MRTPIIGGGARRVNKRRALSFPVQRPLKVPRPHGPWPIAPDGSITATLAAPGGFGVTIIDGDRYHVLMEFPYILDRDGYVRVRRYGKGGTFNVYLHRRIARPPAGVIIDHKFGVRHDNRRSRLRRATASQNSYNRPAKAGTSSCYRGVTRHRTAGRWQAQIRHEGVMHYLGLARGEWEAAKLYNDAARKFFGKWAHLNSRTPHLERDQMARIAASGALAA